MICPKLQQNLLKVCVLPASFSLSDEMHQLSLGVFEEEFCLLQFSQRPLAASPRSPSSSEQNLVAGSNSVLLLEQLHNINPFFAVKTDA